MGNINSNVKRLIRYNNIRYKEFAKRVGLGVGTVRSAFSRDKDEVWMRAFEYGYELGSKSYMDDSVGEIGIPADVKTWQERLSGQKGWDFEKKSDASHQ